MSLESIRDRIHDRGLGLRADDVREIELDLITLPLDEQHEAGPWIWEAVSLIVNDPDYKGDAKVPGLAAP